MDFSTVPHFHSDPFDESASEAYNDLLPVFGEGVYQETQSILADGGLGVSSVAFDLQEELLWMGNQGGHVTSYYALGLQRYTSFQVHPTDEVKQIISIDSGILCLTQSSLRCQLRRGIPIFTCSSDNMMNMLCMLQVNNNSLLLGGHQNTLVEINLHRAEENKVYPIAEDGCAILKRNARFVVCGDPSGKVILRDPNSLRLEHVLDAHMGSLSDVDVHGNLIVTCGFSTRLGSLSVDRFLKVYDIRIMRAVSPIPVVVDPFLLKFIPSFSSKLAVVSPHGQMQLVDTAALTQPQLYLYQVNTGGSICMTFDVSSSCQCLSFGDSGGYIHLFSTGSSAIFNNYSRPTEFPDPIETLPSISIDDELTPLSSIPLHFNAEPYLSSFPAQYCKKVYRKTPKIDIEILRSMKVVQSIGCAPNPGNRRRNQVPYKLEKRSARKTSTSDSIGGKNDEFSGIVVPKKYRKVEVKYSKLGTEDFDFDYYNKTSFSGLEANLPNSYCNAMLHVLYFIPYLRAAVFSHLCQREFCLTCELSFLFHMLDISMGFPCQPNNFLRAFRTLPEVSALGLILSDQEESKRKINMCRLIQSWNRFVLQQLHSECTEKKTEESTKSGKSDSLDKDIEKLSVKDNSSDPEQNKPKAYTSRVESSIITDIFGASQEIRNRCCCSEVKSKLTHSLLYNLVYPDIFVQGKSPIHCSFFDILEKSICLEQITPAWCDKCQKYQSTTQTRYLNTLPNILVLNCGLDCLQDMQFFKGHMFSSNPAEDNVDAHKKQGFKPCRYGTNCSRVDCKFWHARKSTCEEANEESPTVLSSWIPLSLEICLLSSGKIKVRNSMTGKEEKPTNTAGESVKTEKQEQSSSAQEENSENKEWVQYELTAVVNHIADPKHPDKNNLVSCIKVAPSYHERLMGSPVSQWYIFNDFSITPIPPEESVYFPLDWKLPCILYWTRVKIDKITLPEKNLITADVFCEDESLAQKGETYINFVPLKMNEMPEKGQLVAMDAEFVSLVQEEAVLRSDGTRSTIKPSHMSVARITCIRGQGPMEGIPFIDDYISTQEQVVDYLTKFSGIKPGDLDANISSHHLTTLKSTYLKMRYLVDIGVKFVGHGLKNDFRVINMVVPPDQILDTVLLFHLPHQRMVSLRFLAWHFLGIKIQSGNHDSIEDARAALKLYRKYQELERDNKVAEALKELYEAGRNLQWKLPGSGD